MKQLEKDLIRIVKQHALAQGMTQAQLARHLQVSLITVKRWYAGKGLTLDNLKRISDRLGLRLSDIFSSVESSQLRYYYYTLEQERALASHPEWLALFDLLISGHTLSQIKKRYAIREHMMTSLLTQLDRLELIELYPKNKFKLKQPGEPRWNAGGPLEKTFRKKMIEQFLGEHEKPHASFFIHDYLDSDAEHIRKKLHELRELMYAANTRASFTPSDAQSYGLYIAFRPFEWNLRDHLKEKAPH